MTAQVILNPFAGRWAAQRRLPEVREILNAAGMDYQLTVTRGPGDATQLAAQAVQAGFSPIIAAGGDGTISEVVNGLLSVPDERASSTPLGILPLGSANDLVANLRMPRTLAGSVENILAGRTRCLDLGLVISDEKQRYFDNNSAIGLEPYVTLIQQRITRIQGAVRYLAAALRGILAAPRWQAALEWDGGSYEGPISLVTVGNGAVTGGLFYMAPHADPFDGRLTFVYAFIPSRLKMLRLLQRAMRPGPGNYVEDPSVHEVHSPRLRIRIQPGTPLHADGEIQSVACRQVEYRLLPGALPVLG